MNTINESEDFYRCIYNSMDIVVFVIDRNDSGAYFFVSVNSAYEKMTSLKENMVTGKAIEDILSPERASALRLHCALCVDNGIITEYEEMIPMQGEENWWITRLIPLEFADGKFSRIVGTSTSITERKTMELRMGDTIEFTEKIIANSPLGIATYHNSGRCMTANGSFVNMIGAPDRATVMNQNFYKIRSWRESGLYERVVECMETGETKWRIIEIITTFGRHTWLSCFIIPFHIKGELHIILMIDDISIIKKSELAAREGMMFVNTLIDTIPNPIFYKDTEGKYIGCNSAFEHFIGLPKMKILGKSVFEIADEELALMYQEKDRELLDNPPKQVYEARVKAADGSIHYMQFYKALFSAEGDIPAGIIGVMLDITERKRTEDMLRELSLVDSLTNLGNRRSFDDMMNAEWSRSIRDKKPLSLLMIDIDFFKRFNDRYGHQQGDLCLAAVASAIKNSCQRGGDFPARYGGEEFAVILPQVHRDGAVVVAERILDAVRNLRIAHIDSAVFEFVTVSVGAATIEPAAENEWKDLVFMADAALYRSKGSGRNRVES